MKATVCLFDYTDYRTYLKHFYDEQKRIQSGYSYRGFARKARLASPNYLKLVIDGSRRITDKNLPNFIRGLKLGRAEAEYFRNLVYQSEVKDTEARSEFKGEVERLRNNFFKRAREINRSRLEILKSWRHWAIREMVLLDDFQADPKWIAKRLRGGVTPEQVAESLRLLEQLEFIRKEEGRFVLSEPLITTTDEIPSEAIRELHCQFMALGAASVLRDRLEEREISALTIALSASRLGELKAALKSFRQELNRTFSKPRGNEEVYHLVINLFPLTSSKTHGGR